MKRPNTAVTTLAMAATLAALPACKRHGAATPPAEALHLAPALAADEPMGETVGNAVLADGGSAADAAVAAALALGAENPSSSGLGGGGFAVVWDATAQRAYALDFRERAPRGTSADHYRRPDGQVDTEASKIGCYAIGVPGEPAGLEALHQRFGKLSWERLVEPAKKIATDGATVTPYVAHAIEAMAPQIEQHPGIRALLSGKDGTLLKTGDVLRNEDLATTLGLYERDGADAIYKGPIATAIANACRDADGAVNQLDLADYHPIWRAPIVARWRGYDVVTVPPPSSGGVVLVEMLHILEPVPFDRDGADAALSYHMLVEAMKNGFADRATSFGDPDYVQMPVEELTSPEYAEQLRAQIDVSRTRPPGFYGRPGVHTQLEDHGTTNISVVDAAGNAVALTTSVNDYFGSLIVAPQTGIVLNDTMDDFSHAEAANVYGLVGSSKNAYGPGRRPVSSMAPTIFLQDKKVRLALGGAGGPRITSSVLQVALGVLAEGKDVERAVDYPRVHHQWSPDLLYMEPQVPKVIADELIKRGHRLAEAPSIAAVEAVEVKDGKAIAADDPRKKAPPPPAAPTPAPRDHATKPK